MPGARNQPKRALIGWSGFVGTTLRGQFSGFDDQFRAADIAAIAGGDYDLVVCAGAPGAKWRANREPEADRASIERLIAALRGVHCDRFVLISTVDVLSLPNGVDEASPVHERGLPPYGKHRYALEQFVRQQFPESLIVRLPGLVGPGLRKNVLFDLLNGGSGAGLDGNLQVQYYPMANLWADIVRAQAAGLSLIHLVAEPLRLRQVAEGVFGTPCSGPPVAAPGYDVRTRFSGNGSPWTVSAEVSLAAIRAYASQEPKAVRGNA